MAARLETQAGPDPVEPGQEILPPRRHRIALQQRGAADDQANRISRRMTIDAEEAVTHRGRPQAAFTLTAAGRVAAPCSTIVITSARRATTSGRCGGRTRFEQIGRASCLARVCHYV